MPTASRLVLLALVLLPAACTPPVRNPVPADLINEATIPGLPGGRFWGDAWPTYNLPRFEAMSEAELREEFPASYGEPHHYLAISGGGANGAFGAGLLAGWTDAGTRPEFTMVTGVSTGALSAPYAFLGSDWDDKLEEVYTTVQTSDLLEHRGILDSLFWDSMADTSKLRGVIETIFDEEVIDAIAAEHLRGRRLFIGTANLDAGRPVIWSIGEIAASDYPDRVRLVHDILQASSAIPVAFSPVIIPVEANGVAYDEMHVDGGTSTQVFVYPAAIDWHRVTERLAVPGSPNVYVIRNAFMDASHQGVNRNIMPIAGRTIDSLIRTQGIGDLYQIHALCQRDGNDFHLAYIPAEFDVVPNEAFDPVYMTELFEFGYEAARSGGYSWTDVPPGFGFDR